MESTKDLDKVEGVQKQNERVKTKFLVQEIIIYFVSSEMVKVEGTVLTSTRIASCVDCCA